MVIILCRGLLALLILAYLALNGVAPLSTALFKLKADWPGGWAGLESLFAGQDFSLGGVGTGRYTALMEATNWLQVAMWLGADGFYLASVFGLFGRRPRDAVSLFAVGWVLDVATWLTFARMPVYGLTFAPIEQEVDLVLFGVMAAAGGLMWLCTRPKRPGPRTGLLLE